MARVKDILPTRRDVLRLGGLALAGTSLDHLVWPLEIHANGQTDPRGTARNCIFIELGGAISPMDCWDFKQTRYTRKETQAERADRWLSLRRPSTAKPMRSFCGARKSELEPADFT